MKKSQASTEFIIILSMILIITIISVQIISPAPLFNFQEKNNRDYWDNAQISLKVTSNDTKSILTIRNNLRLPINVTNVSLGNYQFVFPPSYITAGNYSNILSNTTIYEGTFDVNIEYLVETEKFYFKGNNVKLSVNRAK